MHENLGLSINKDTAGGFFLSNKCLYSQHSCKTPLEEETIPSEFDLCLTYNRMLPKLIYFFKHVI